MIPVLQASLPVGHNYSSLANTVFWLNRYLALICLMRKDSIEKQGLVDFNVQVFQNALQRVFEVGR